MSFLRKVHNDGIVIQINELLNEYPEILQYRMDKNDFPSEKIGKGNPYHKCTGCEKTNPQISIDGHLKNCKWVIGKRTFDLLYMQLDKWEKANLEFILQELNY